MFPPCTGYIHPLILAETISCSLQSPTMDSFMTDESVFLDDVFFDTPCSTSPLAQAYLRRRVLEPPTPDALATIPESARGSAAETDGVSSNIAICDLVPILVTPFLKECARLFLQLKMTWKLAPCTKEAAHILRLII